MMRKRKSGYYHIGKFVEGDIINIPIVINGLCYDCWSHIVEVTKLPKAKYSIRVANIQGDITYGEEYVFQYLGRTANDQ